jgi:hypothetical protein
MVAAILGEFGVDQMIQQGSVNFSETKHAIFKIILPTPNYSPIIVSAACQQ